MRERQFTKITTDSIEQHHQLLPDASFQERAEELKTYVRPYTKPDGTTIQFFTVQCDGCGIAMPIEYDDPQLPPGWRAQEDGEFCPNCASPELPLTLPAPIPGPHWLTQYDPEDGSPIGTTCHCDIPYDHDGYGNPVP